jgi:hypothetical protein
VAYGTTEAGTTTTGVTCIARDAGRSRRLHALPGVATRVGPRGSVPWVFAQQLP